MANRRVIKACLSGRTGNQTLSEDTLERLAVVNQDVIRSRAKKAVFIMCDLLGCERVWLCSSHRPRACDGRAMIYLWLKQSMGLSTVTIGGMFGRDHSTVYSALKHIAGILDTEPNMKVLYHEFELNMQP